MNVTSVFLYVILAVVSVEVLKVILNLLTAAAVVAAVRLLFPMFVVGVVAWFATGKIDAALAMATSVPTVLLTLRRSLTFQ